MSTEPVPPWFETVAFHTVLAGLCPLVPLPFVDQLILAQVRKRMVRDLGAGLQVPLSEPQVAVLSGVAPLEPSGGCLEGCLTLSLKLSISLVLRFFKKIVLVLTLKEAIDEAAKTFHEGVLLHRALTRHADVLPRTGVDDERQSAARRIRTALEAADDQVPHRPIHQVVAKIFEGSKDALMDGVRLLGRGRKGKTDRDALPETTDDKGLRGLTDRLRDALWAEQETISKLDDSLDRAMGPDALP